MTRLKLDGSEAVAPFRVIDSDGATVWTVDERGHAETFEHPSQLRIVCLGDSTTEGIAGESGTAYRSELWQLLQADPGRATFVGSRSSGPNTPTAHYYELGEYLAEAYGGCTCQEIEALVDRSTYTGDVDYVLVHAVTNNLLDGGATMLKRTGKLIDTIRRKWPTAKVLVSTCQPSNLPGDPAPTKALKNANIAVFNAGLDALCKAHAAEYVDVFGTLTTAQLLADGIHPSGAGDTQVATLWAYELRKRVRCAGTDIVVPRSFASMSNKSVVFANHAADFVSIPYLAAAEIDTKTAIVSCWVRVTNFDPSGGGAGTQYCIFEHGATAATSLVLQHGTVGQLELWVAGVNVATWYLALTLNTWALITLYADTATNQFHLWVNDRYFGPSVPVAYTLNDPGVTHLGVGSDPAFPLGMVGNIASYMVCTTSKLGFRWAGLTPLDVFTRYYDDLALPGPCYHYTLSEGVGAPADALGLGAAATLGGGAAWATLARP